MQQNDAQPKNVLVVEDEMVLRIRAVDIVEGAGFTAIEAANADQALVILESRSDISLLFTDIQMPGSIDGLKLAHTVHRRWPEIKIVLVSGQVRPTEADKPIDSRFFGKPLEVKQMIAELQEMVGAGALAIVPDAIVPAVIERVLKITSMAVVPRLEAENENLRLLLEQAGLDAKVLLAQAGIEAKERQAADTLQQLILGEMHHRIKNTLANVGAIATQSMRTAPSMEHAQQAIEGRLAALSRAHDMLMQANWANANLLQTVRSAIEPYDSAGAERFSIHGPDVLISSETVLALAMTFNELCTNTTKFGALSVPEGRVLIEWLIDDEKKCFSLTWTEEGGPAVTVPTRRSFGTRMIGSLGQQLNGRVQLDYEPAGLIYSLFVPLESLTEVSKASAIK